MEILSSLKNPKVMTWRSLKDRKGRLETGLFLAEGRKMTDEALASGYRVEAVLVDTDRDDMGAIPFDGPVYGLPAHVFASVCDTKTPQGIAAVVRAGTGKAVRGDRLLALDGVQDPGNVGTIIRTADAAGMDGILMSEECADVYSPKVLRATMGSIFRMPVATVRDLPAELIRLRQAGWSILSSQLDGTPFYERTGVGEKFCLVVGNEGNGISEPVKAAATHRLRLPMRGGAESLNAAVAAAIMMYDLTK